MNLKDMKNIYMVGIKGVGMTMLAQFLVSKGFNISGSDTDERFMTDSVLKKSGIKVFNGFSVDNIPSETDLVIYSTAYNIKNNEELVQIKKEKRRMMTYAESLGDIFNEHDGIAVIGSHGKTTVSAWLGYVMWKSNLNPNVLVGSSVPQFKGCCVAGKSRYFVAEVDEYQNKLKYFNPEIGILNNIDHDHHDFFKTKKEYVKAFKDFVKKIPKRGFLVANFDDKEVEKISKGSKGKVISYGLKNKKVDYIGKEIEQTNYGQRFSIDGLGSFRIKLLGKHNVLNALAVISTCIKLGVNIDVIRKNLAEFKGTERRLQILGQFKKAIIIDDYAHHPTEIKTTLDGISEMYKDKNIITVFHPHTYTRTKNLLNQFSKSFIKTDELIVLDIYGSAREKQGGVHSRDLIKKIKKYNINRRIKQSVKYIPSLEKCEEYLRKNLSGKDIVILMGAGDVFRIGNDLLKKKI